MPDLTRPLVKLHLVKLCVGVDSLGHLIDYRDRQSADAIARGFEDVTVHVTRMWPKRRAELLAGGSLYWVIKGAIAARQEILRFDARIGADAIRRCAIIMAPDIIATRAAPRRPFQGWRYLDCADAPPDLPTARLGEVDLPETLALALSDIGLV